ncbi:thioredoxin family protein [Telmatobacter bradus]|uniref:thioredoxin family protein n=1 Tax=Telmatobacter bradus TaxID=474953 RepID=UPI003B43866F
MALTESTMLELGTIAPDFSLTDVLTGKTVCRDDFLGKKAILVVFLCPHCPYVKHMELNLGELCRMYAAKPLGIVAINSNDVVSYPADNSVGMMEQAQANNFNFPYLLDDTQEVAKAFHATCTPDVFIFNKEFKLVYRGEWDSSRPGNGIPVSGEDVRFSIDLTIGGHKVPDDQRAGIGCEIRWKP